MILSEQGIYPDSVDIKFIISDIRETGCADDALRRYVASFGIKPFGGSI